MNATTFTMGFSAEAGLGEWNIIKNLFLLS